MSESDWNVKLKFTTLFLLKISKLMLIKSVVLRGLQNFNWNINSILTRK